MFYNNISNSTNECFISNQSFLDFGQKFKFGLKYHKWYFEVLKLKYCKIFELKHSI